MNPTGVFFIRQAEQERPASPADPATLSSLGIWHRNFNGKATQAGRSVEETHCACQSELTNWCEHSECATLLAWWFVTRREKGRGWQERGVLKGSRGTSMSHAGQKRSRKRRVKDKGDMGLQCSCYRSGKIKKKYVVEDQRNLPYFNYHRVLQQMDISLFMFWLC